MVKLENDNHKNDVKRFDKAIFWIILAVLLMMIGATRCSAQEAVTELNRNMMLSSDVIPVPKTVYEYIITCHTHNIKPNLGIRLKNGQITGIIRYKPVYRRKK